MPENALVRLKKTQTIPFIDTSATSTPAWARIGKSTIFDLVLNANVVTSDYIDSEMPIDDVDYYKPSLAQELAALKGDPAFDYLYDMFYELPVGEALKKNVLLVFGGNACTSADAGKAWLVNATVVLTDFNSVDGKILFSLNFGDITRGTVVITDGAPVFTAASE